MSQSNQPMRKFAFLSRHTPTDEQFRLANDQGIFLEYIGDADAFRVTPGYIAKRGSFDGVVVVHPAAALRLVDKYEIGVFENANRAPIGEKPQFQAIQFHIY